MTSEGLGEMFQSDSADTCPGKFPLKSMGGQAEGLACADLGARTPIGVSGNKLELLSPQIPPGMLQFCLPIGNVTGDIRALFISSTLIV